MNVMKKINKKKHLLKVSKYRKPSIDIKNNIIISLQLQDKEIINIRGKFQFMVINGYLEMDQFKLKNNLINNFESKEYVTIKAHNLQQDFEEILSKFQQQSDESSQYSEFLNYILKNKPNSFTFLIIGEYETTEFGYLLSEEKEKLINQQEKSIIFVGEKGIGKSTTLQLCGNKLMNKGAIFILDTDLGQSLSLPGFITLLKLEQPLFLQKPQIYFQGFVGEYSVFNYLDLYFNKVSQALEVYHQSQLLRDYPLLINTAGFITSYGITIIQELINILSPQLCIIISRGDQQKIKEKSKYLLEELQKRSFISYKETIKTNIKLLSEKFNFEESGYSIITQTPQIRKQNRMEKISNNLGLQNLNYITLCQANYQILNVNKFQFVVINEKKNYFDLEEIASVFIFSLVAIEFEGQFIGLGFIKDLDIINNQLYLISQVNFNNSEYYLIKSKHYDISNDQLGDFNIEEIYNFLDEQNIQNGQPLEYDIDLPFLQNKSEAIADFKHKITVNKKTY